MRPIDADWVMNALTVYGQSYDYVSVGRVTKVIEDAPTIDAELVRRGKWVEVTNGRGGHECSICHAYAAAWQTGEERLTDYCPVCGAKMEGQE